MKNISIALHPVAVDRLLSVKTKQIQLLTWQAVKRSQIGKTIVKMREFEAHAGVNIAAFPLVCFGVEIAAITAKLSNDLAITA